MSAMTTSPFGALTLNPAPRLRQFRREQAARDRAIQLQQARRLSQASAQEHPTK
jgi:hypothetical protein